MPIYAIVEGDMDAALVRRLFRLVGDAEPKVFTKNGRDPILKSLSKYLKAARNVPGSGWIVLIDLDRDECAPAVLAKWASGDLPPRLCLRIAVRQVEAWILADRDGVTRALGVGVDQVPWDVEGLLRPKRTIVDLARKSRRGAIRQALVPREASGREVGPGYTSWAIGFIRDAWNPEAAAGRAPSLQKTISCIRRLLAATDTGA